MEMMHHVRRGGLWAWEERSRISRVGEDDPSVPGSPYPSAWRGATPNEPIRRGGSLRVPREVSPFRRRNRARPRLSAMSSSESLKASEEMLDDSNGSPAGVKLWASWRTRSSTPGTDAMSTLLSSAPPGTIDTRPQRQGPYPPSRGGSMEQSSPTIPPPREGVQEQGPSIQLYDEPPPSPFLAYEDGIPIMTFLDGESIVSDPVREVIRRMVEPKTDMRPTAAELRQHWRELQVGVEEE